MTRIENIHAQCIGIYHNRIYAGLQQKHCTIHPQQHPQGEKPLTGMLITGGKCVNRLGKEK